jgi:pilus assembly protein Flp/PilA
VDAIRKTIRKLCVDQSGATAIEYGLIVALIAVAIMGALQGLGGGVGGMWDDLRGKVENNM